MATTEILEIIAPWGPFWVLIIASAWVLLPKIAEHITVATEARRKREEAIAEIERTREERKQRESEERSRLEGQWLTVQQQSNAVIENNTAAVKNSTHVMEKLEDNRHEVTKKIDCVIDLLDRHDEKASEILTQTKILGGK